MNPFTIPFSVAAEHIPGVLSGQVVRYGAILKDSATGQILGHVQETGLAQKILQTGLSFDPTGATGLIGVAQNVAIAGKLNSMQQALGSLQVLQYASLFSSVVGVGVSAASTAMILKRLSAVDDALSRIESSIDNLPTKWRELALRSRLVDVSTSIERLHEASLRSDASKVVSQVEKDLQKDFNHIHDGLCSVVIEAKIDPKDIAFIHPSSKTLVKLTAYDFSIYGGLEGKIVEISADSIKDVDSKDNKSFYKVVVKTDKNYLEHNGEKLIVIPGMVAQVDIITGKKTIMDFFLKPILKVKDGAFHER